MKGTELPLASNDLVAITGQEGVVHLVFPDRKTGMARICRPSMLRSTLASTEKGWETLGNCVESRLYKSSVENLGRRVCKVCLWLG
jgi:hypothetical protein